MEFPSVHIDDALSMPLGKLLFLSKALDVAKGVKPASSYLTREEKETMRYIREHKEEMLKLIGINNAGKDRTHDHGQDRQEIDQ